MKIGEYDTKSCAVHAAKQLENGSGQSFFVQKCFDGSYVIVSKMPLMGEWYTSDGIQHGR